MTKSTTLPVLGVDAEVVPERILVVGDPARAERLGDRLDGGEVVGRNREYVLVVGEHGGQRVGVASHGVGGPGAALCFEELIRGGAQRIIRAGTCGGMQPHVLDGAIVVATAAVRDDGLSERLVPTAYPAIGDVDVTLALRNAARAADVDAHEGIVLTGALFYPGDVLGSDLAQWARAGVIAVDMEVATLFVVASLRGVAAGAILAADGNPLAEQDDDMTGYDPHRQVVADAVDAMLGVALDALIA